MDRSLSLSLCAVVALAGAAARERAADPGPAGYPAPAGELARGSVIARSRDELLRALGEARPGTAILLAPGTYHGGIHVSGPQGAPGRPVVLAALDPRHPPVIRGGQSGLQLSDPSHVELRDLVLEGARANGLNIDDAGTFETPAQEIVLRRLLVRDVGPEGNHDGIKLSGVAEFLIEDCTVERWGRGGSAIDMVGCRRGVVAGCTFRHDEPPGASGVQVKGGSHGITIRRSRFLRAGARAVNIGGSTGREYFRPRPEGFEAREITVEDCVFVGSQAPVAFAGADGAVVRFNTIYRPRRWVVRILQETRDVGFVPCRRGRFLRNVIAYRSDELHSAVNIGPATAPETFEFAENFWSCLDRPERSREVAGQLPVPEREGTYGRDPRLRDPEAGDLSLEPGSPAAGAGVRPFPRSPDRRGGSRHTPEAGVSGSETSGRHP